MVNCSTNDLLVLSCLCSSTTMHQQGKKSLLSIKMLIGPLHANGMNQVHYVAFVSLQPQQSKTDVAVYTPRCTLASDQCTYTSSSRKFCQRAAFNQHSFTSGKAT